MAPAQTLDRETIRMSALTVYPNGKKEAIHWQRLSLDEAVAKAKVENKHILIYFTAKWCGPCQQMEQTVFPDNKVIRTVNDHYIALKIDVDAWGSKKWTMAFAVRPIPDFIILDAAKRRLRHQIGYMKQEQLLTFLDLDTSFIGMKATDTLMRKYMPEKWKMKLLTGMGAGVSNITRMAPGAGFAYELHLGMSVEKKRVFFAVPLSFSRLRIETQHLDYFRIPLYVGVNLYRGSLLGLSGGFRMLGGPYYGRLLSGIGMPAQKNNFGMDYGMGAYIGDSGTASLMVALKISNGFNDAFPALPGKQRNRFAGLSVIFALRN